MVRSELLPATVEWRVLHFMAALENILGSYAQHNLPDFFIFPFYDASGTKVSREDNILGGTELWRDASAKKKTPLNGVFC